MAEETQAKASGVAEVVVAETAPAAEEETKKPATEEPPTTAAEEKTAVAEVDSATLPAGSFKEESNIAGDLEDPEKKALDELKQLIQAALVNNEFDPPPPPPPPPAPAAPEDPPAKTEEEAKIAEEPKTEEEAKIAEEPKTEEGPKTAEPVPKVEEEPKIAEPTPSEELTKVELEETDPPKLADEPTVTTKVEETEPPKPEAAEADDKAVVHEDGAKTVEAIEETVVPIPNTPPPPTAAAEQVTPEAADPAPPPEEVFIWGVPLVGDEKSDTVLLKFLRARDFNIKDALSMMKNAVIWRKQFGIDDGLLDEDLGVAPELEKVVFMHGNDKEGHPVCYNVYGEFQDRELYSKAFGDEEKRQKFLKWRIQFLEKGIRQQLDFTPGAVCAMVQVTDLKNVPGPGKRELRQATKQALSLLQDNYPEFVAKQIFINVPWWYLAYNRMISSIFTQRSKSKFVFAGLSRSADTLFKYIAPEQVPVQYGGLSKEDPDFTTSDAVTEVTIKPSSKHTIEIPATETCLLVWELRVLGWEVSYGAEFMPSTETGYTVIVTKVRKFAATDEPVVKNSFKIGEPGKVVLTINNVTSKKKKLLYRSKVKSATESV